MNARARAIVLGLWVVLSVSVVFARGTTLVLDATSEPVSVDPHVATSVDFYLMRNVYEPLVDVDTDGVTIVGVLAESWTVAEDGMSFEFALRPDVMFSDGTPLTAEAVKASIERLAAMKRGSAWVVAPVESVEVTGELTLSIAISRPFPFLQALPLVYIVSPTAVEGHEANGDLAAAWLNDNSAGTGPYKLSSWRRGESLEFERNEHYWGGWSGSHFDRVTVQTELDPSTARLLLEAGDVDALLNFSFDDLPAFDANPEIEIVRAPSLQQLYLRLNAKYGPTSDPRVRRAIALAWNPDDWQVFVGNSLPSDGPTPRELLGPDFEPPAAPVRDLNEARRLLEEAGYPNGFTLNYLMDDYEYKRVFGELLQAQLGEIGINVNITVVSSATFFERVQSVDADGDGPNALGAFLLRAVPRIPDAYSFLYFLYYSDAQEGFGRNYFLYENDEVDELIARAIQATDLSDKIALYRQANELIYLDQPDVFVEKSVFITPMRTDIKGFQFRPSELWFPFRFYELYRD